MSRPKLSVRMVYLLLGVFAIVALAPLASVAWRLIDGSRETIKTSQQEYQHLLASTISRELDAHVEALRSQLRRGAHSLASAKTGTGDVAGEVRRVLDEIVDDRVLYLRFTDVQGKVLKPPSDEVQPSELEPLFDAGYLAAAEILEEGEDVDSATTKTSPVLLPGDPPSAALLIAEPIVAKGRFLGVVSALVDLQSVWESVAESRNAPHAMFAVDAGGRLFAKTKHLDVALGRDMADSEIVKRFKDTTGSFFETMPYAWSPSSGKPSERYIGSYTVSRQGWGIFVQASEREVYGPVSEMIRNTLTWGLLALAGAMLAAIVFARSVADPIKRLTEVTRALSLRDFSVQVPSTAIAEVAELADRFRGMAEKIEEHIRQLKRAADENHELFIGTAKALTSAIDAKDPYTKGHSERVNRYSVTLARYHGLSEERLHEINIASLLHDVGKLGVDDAILKKQGALTDEEFAIMKRHTTIGEKIMSEIRQMKAMLPGLKSHHERWAGGGYPEGLAGEAIPLMARIIAVADSFDAMTTERPYQKAMTREAAWKRVNDLKGKNFDERIVESFNRGYENGEFVPPAQKPAPVHASAAT